jgi:hypothetical protein
MQRPVLLTDEQMRSYVINGYVTVRADLPEEFHSDLRTQLEELFEKEGNPGNNILPKLPEIHRVFQDPAVVGAVTGLLGEDYYLHPHRHCHCNPPGSAGQNMHIDSWNRRAHPTRWAMALYYPQATPELLGPTGVVPSSHFYNTYHAESDPEIPVCGEAGTVTIIHYDIWHRAMPNRSDQNRFMLKFLFARMAEPTVPSWDCKSTEWVPHSDHAFADQLQPLWRSLWDWHCGQACQKQDSKIGASEVDELLEMLDHESETVGLNAAYKLGSLPVTAPRLTHLLSSESELARHNAGYALTTMGEHAVDYLVGALDDTSDRTRTIAVKLLGNLGPVAGSSASRVAQVMEDVCSDVRDQAAEALGNFEVTDSVVIQALIRGLGDPDERVRRNSALSLAHIGPRSEAAVPALIVTLSDEDRYARANAVEALKRIGTSGAVQALLRDLATSRWCAQTNPESTF